MSQEKFNLEKTEENISSQIKKEWKEISINDEELVEIFDEKFKDSEMLIPLMNNQGVPVTNNEGQRAFLTPDKISASDKREHMLGLMKEIDQSVFLIERLSKEKELLDFLEKKESNLKSLIQKYQENID